MKRTFRTFSLALFANFQDKLFTSLLQLASQQHRQVHQGMKLVNFERIENYISPSFPCCAEKRLCLFCRG